MIIDSFSVANVVVVTLKQMTLLSKADCIATGNRECRAHLLQNARISFRKVNVRSRAYPLNTGDL